MKECSWYRLVCIYSKGQVGLSGWTIFFSRSYCFELDHRNTKRAVAIKAHRHLTESRLFVRKQHIITVKTETILFCGTQTRLLGRFPFLLLTFTILWIFSTFLYNSGFSSGVEVRRTSELWNTRSVKCSFQSPTWRFWFRSVLGNGEKKYIYIILKLYRWFWSTTLLKKYWFRTTCKIF